MNAIYCFTMIPRELTWWLQEDPERRPNCSQSIKLSISSLMHPIIILSVIFATAGSTQTILQWSPSRLPFSEILSIFEYADAKILQKCQGSNKQFCGESVNVTTFVPLKLIVHWHHFAPIWRSNSYLYITVFCYMTKGETNWLWWRSVTFPPFKLLVIVDEKLIVKVPYGSIERFTTTGNFFRDMIYGSESNDVSRLLLPKVKLVSSPHILITVHFPYFSRYKPASIFLQSAKFCDVILGRVRQLTGKKGKKTIRRKRLCGYPILHWGVNRKH